MKSFRILIFMALVLALLAGICVHYPQEGVDVGSLNVHFPSITKILNPQRQLDVEAYLAQQDSLEAVMRTKQDSLNHYRHQVDSSDIRFWFPGNDDSFFDNLFAQFESTRTSGRTIRIVHYGDSQIESDRMSRRLRSYMQQHFGGGGPGMVPFGTLIPTLAVSTYGSGSIRRQSPFGDSTVVRASGNYGPMVQDFRVTGSASSTITAGTHASVDNRVKHFSRFRLIFNNRPGPLDIHFADKKGTFVDDTSFAAEGVHSVSWTLDSATTQVQISLTGNADLYGILVDNGPGVAVDNIPMRGCSGHQFTQINAEQLAAAYAQMDIGLIILQFGGNSVPYLKGEKSIDAYCQSMAQQIDRIHHCCPRAKILFIGPSDMTTRESGELRSYACLPMLVEKLQTMANAHGAAYWSIYHAMGGQNSMEAWVDQGLGGPDYIHFTTHGVDIMGDRLAKAFDNMYQIYKLRKEVTDAGI